MQKNLPYIFISFGIAIIVCLLSFLDVYDNFEHTLLDMRFKSRGLIKTRSDIATADIDVKHCKLRVSGIHGAGKNTYL